MNTKSFTPTYPNSFWAMPVGSLFFATDLGGLTISPKFSGIRVTRTGSEAWDLDTFRVHSEAPANNMVRVDRWPIAATGSSFIRSMDRHFPPDLAGRPSGSGHYPGTLPPELFALLTDVSWKQS